LTFSRDSDIIYIYDRKIIGDVMTCGIYKLNFKGTDKVYIGQSMGIETRYKAHLDTFSSKKHTAKLMEAYNLYSYPDLEILLECDRGELDELEHLAIEGFNSVVEGFNTTSKICGGISPGELNGNSKFSNSQIIEVFNMLIYSSNYSYRGISSITGVSIDTIKQIVRGKNHTWLSEYNTIGYQKMLQAKGSKASFSNSLEGIGRVHPDIISPEGRAYTITNIKSFAEEHNLTPSNLGCVLRGSRKSHKGWRLA
jgi:hypothetical protein